jgi:hypothetical protein
LTSGRRPVEKIIAESLSQHDEKHVVPTPLIVGKGRKKKNKLIKINLNSRTNYLAQIKLIPTHYQDLNPGPLVS